MAQQRCNESSACPKHAKASISYMYVAALNAPPSSLAGKMIGQMQVYSFTDREKLVNDGSHPSLDQS